jgi:hypothetical protein
MALFVYFGHGKSIQYRIPRDAAARLLSFDQSITVLYYLILSPEK